MAQISHADKEIKLKVVYYGPALCGKTTNLIYVHQVLFPNQKVKLFSINTGDDRTLFFDLLPLELGRINGYELKLQLFTVPGQVRYNQTRRAVLSKTDGVVFVADSQKNEMDANQESFDNMKENLEANHIDYQTVPLVVQYNKQDLENILHPEELGRALNDRNAPSFGAIAITGVGVLQTLKQSILQVLGNFNQNFPDFPVSEIEDKIDRSFEAVLETYQKKIRTPVPAGEAETSFRNGLQSSAHNIKVKENRENISQEQLLEKAVETNIEMAELFNELNTTKNLLEQRNRELTILGQVAQALTEDFDPEQLPRMLFRSILMTFQTAHGALLEYRFDTKQLRELFISGFDRDPLAAIPIAPGKSVAQYLFEQKTPFSLNVFSFEKRSLPGRAQDDLVDALKKLKIMALMSVPIRSSGLDYGLLVVYQMINESSVLKAFSPEEMKFLSRLSTPISLAFEKMLLSGKVKELDQSVDQLVHDQTSELREKHRTLQAKNRDLQHQLSKLETLLTPVLRMEQRRERTFQHFKTEISKPTSAILMGAKILEKFGIQQQENVDRFLNVVRDESGKLQKAVTALDTATDKYFQNADFTRETFPLPDLLDELYATYQPVIQVKNLEWRRECPDQLPMICGDKEKIRFVLAQLVENALHFTSSGYVELKVQFDPIYQDRCLVVSISDSGAGIARENLPRIFERFFREEEDFGSENTNFGLGLTFCKEIVDHFGGRIWAKSEEGVGTTIFVELPVQSS